ncbi:ribonuclease, Rne/Rng family [Meinhardsimonia xiamenensis]|jgi:Ribonuclease G/E|uniref:Ribonuclease, Rne/Rng family n=1 Tax=Meinhardsimonia xiamenensis TaxID=990712 RepID=A0A1G9C776_9RHOB|nr:ribonuclease E/G [Meinhardsimonia xiamenensis]PRX38464.1 Rne/Rng family ribonuclease [Meinhardsimonia xiamenensis]SDK47527.1 ribonuclease, Rne/Rng family [Meinhardsimonia xiamenensis]
MKGASICLDRLEGRPAAALIINGRVDDLLITPPPEAGPAPETILRAVVERPIKGLGGSIVRLPGGASGFLRKGEPVRPGQRLAVQVTGWAEPGKAIPVTTRVLLKSRHAMATPGAPGINISRRIRHAEARERLEAAAREAAFPVDVGIVLRTAAELASDEELRADLAALRALTDRFFALAAAEGEPALLLPAPDAHELARREWSARNPRPREIEGFSAHGVLEAIDGFLLPEVPLAGGAWASIEPTRAFVAVDVNTGADMSPAAGLKANVALARELPRQLRCRGLGGQIVVDPAPMPKVRRRLLEQEFLRALAEDGVETTLMGWTPLGHVEFRRRRERLPLLRALGRASG